MLDGMEEEDFSELSVQGEIQKPVLREELESTSTSRLGPLPD